MFPFELEENQNTESKHSKLKEYGIDFETGELTGELVEGLEAVKVWVWVTLHTSRYRHPIYSWDFGNEIEDFIGKSYSDEYLNSELQSVIEECLLINENITGIKDFECKRENDRLYLSFTLQTIFAEEEINLNV